MIPQLVEVVVERWQHSLDTGEPFEMEFPLKRRRRYLPLVPDPRTPDA